MVCELGREAPRGGEGGGRGRFGHRELSCPADVLKPGSGIQKQAGAGNLTPCLRHASALHPLQVSLPGSSRSGPRPCSRGPLPAERLPTGVTAPTCLSPAHVPRLPNPHVTAVAGSRPALRPLPAVFSSVSCWYLKCNKPKSKLIFFPNKKKKKRKRGPFSYFHPL